MWCMCDPVQQNLPQVREKNFSDLLIFKVRKFNCKMIYKLTCHILLSFTQEEISISVENSLLLYRSFFFCMSKSVVVTYWWVLWLCVTHVYLTNSNSTLSPFQGLNDCRKYGNLVYYSLFTYITELDKENPDFPPYLISHGQKIGWTRVLLATHWEVADCVCVALQVWSAQCGHNISAFEVA